MSVQNGERLATKQDLADMYQGILPYLGGMPEMVANKFSKGDLYSTEEKMIGQWVDGKPLYQKTLNLSVNCPVNTRTELFLLDSSYDNVLIANAKAYYSSVSNWYLSPYDTNINQSNNNKMVINYDGDSKKIILLNSGFGAAFTREIITIQYTKTTDTAISIGEATEYSTDEKVIGTWIDGKPVWQKSFYVPSVSLTKGVFYTIPNSAISNIDLLISLQGTAVDVYSNCIPLPFINTADVNQGVAFEYLSGGISFRTHNDGYLTFTKICATIQYTKTTD